VQEALPCEVRGRPPSTAPSNAEEDVCTLPEQVADWQSIDALDDEVDEGPVVGWPATG
jgi:hypothetical protein